MTEAETAAVMLEKSYTDTASLKLALHAVVAVAQEVDKGRLPAVAMMTWLTASEFVDAQIIIAKISDGTFEITELWLTLLLGERGIYTAAQIEAIWGL